MATIKQRIDNVTENVTDGKQDIASAITEKGVSSSSGDTFTIMANKIRTIQAINPPEIPAESLENLMESGVSALVIDAVDSDQPVGFITVSCNGSEESYDLQNKKTAVCVNVGGRGDITNVRSCGVRFETGRGFDYEVFARPLSSGNAEYFSGTSDSSYVDLSFNKSYFAVLIIVQYLSA